MAGSCQNPPKEIIFTLDLIALKFLTQPKRAARGLALMKGKLMPVTLRPVAGSDQDFLFQVYASTRRAEVTAWGWNEAQQDAFLRMQFTMQQRAYEMQHAQAAHDIIMLDDEPIGRLLVARSAGEIQLTDISLLTDYRGRGIGSQLITNLLDEADRTGAKVSLQVLKENPAARLYERLGFIRTGEHGLYFLMERPAAYLSPQRRRERRDIKE